MQIATLLLLASTGAALSADLIGQASVIDGDTLEIHGTASASGASMRRKAARFAVAMTACNIGAVRRR
ncbi:hypothetical protein [Bradyrhizobium sp. Rc2d]|uniref:hypothetical protein n=1 Tax=Bradyrhizobium sp. Rc2d TaxID=1855321 RepID=UPI0032DEC5BC